MTNKIYDPLEDGKSSLQLIDFMGGELAIVNDARASYDRTSEKFSEKDLKLLKFLIREKHYSPLRSTVFKFRVKAPISTCRQWVKHLVASAHIDEQNSFNEVSRRYLQLKEPDFYIPTVYRKQSSTNKQCSEGVLNDALTYEATTAYENHCYNSFLTYERLIELGVAREQARDVLPTALYTTWVWTVSLQAVMNFISLRTGKGAQNEITWYAECIKEIVADKCPNVVENW